MKKLVYFYCIGFLLFAVSCSDDKEEVLPGAKESGEYLKANVAGRSFDASIVQYHTTNEGYLVTGTTGSEGIQLNITKDINSKGTYIIPALSEGKSRVTYSNPNGKAFLSGLSNSKDTLIITEITGGLLKGKFSVSVYDPNNENLRIRGEFNVNRED